MSKDVSGLLAGFARDVGANMKGPGLLRIQRQIGGLSSPKVTELTEKSGERFFFTLIFFQV
jgi:hypothetical protein